MAFSITCPKCSAKLKTAAAIPIGRSVQCPKCKTSFAVTNDNMEEVADGKPMASPASKPSAAPKPTVAAASTKAAPARSSRDEDDDDRPARRGAETNGTAKSRKRDDDDEDEKPRSRKRDDDDDDRPRSRKRDDDEDEKPRSRKRDDDDEDEKPRSRKRDDDDEDEKPRSRKRDDDDEDDRPRSRKRDDDDNRDRKRKRDDDEDDKPLSRLRSRNIDDDDDDRPSKRGRDDDDDDDRPSKKKKKKKKKKGGSKMMLWVILGSAVLVVGIGILLFFLLSGGYDKEMMAQMPSDVISVEFQDIEAIMGKDKFKKQMEKEFDGQAEAPILKAGGLSLSGIRRVLEGRNKKGEQLTVIRTKDSVEKGKFTSGGSESKAGSKSYWKVKNGDRGEIFVSFGADDLILLTGSEELMKASLNKEEGKVAISETLDELCKKVAGGTIWDARVNESSGNFGGFEPQGPDADIVKAMMSSKGSASRVDISSSSIDRTHYVLYADSETATKVYEHGKKKREENKAKEEQMFNEMINKNTKLNQAQKDAIRRSIQSASHSQSGKYVESSSSLDISPWGDDLEGVRGF